MFRRRRPQSDFMAEIDAHLELEADRLRQEGLSEEDARVAARRAFGNVARASERFYESGRWLWWDRFAQDVTYAARLLRRSPAFAATTVLITALGIGATTAIFSVVNATLLEPLPFPEPQQLVTIQDDFTGLGARDIGMSQPEWLDLQRSGIFENVSPAWFDENNLTGASHPERVRILIVAPNYFDLLGVKPQLGRTFDPNDSRPGLLPDVVISDGYWKSAFGGDPHVLGRTVRLDTDAYRIIGVMPRGFDAPARTGETRIDVWPATNFYGAPMVVHPPRGGRNLPTAIARLAPGLTIDTAQQRLDALVASLQKQYEGDYPARLGWRVRVVPLKDSVVGDTRRSLVLLLGAVGIVLLVACVNVANLLLARAGARSREMAIRHALGAARTRLIRQLLTESLLLSFIGGGAGLSLLFGFKNLLLRLVPDTLPRLNAIDISPGVLAFALVASIATGVLFGIAPALQADRSKPADALREQGRGATKSTSRAWTGRVLVIAEFALSLVLMAAAALLLRSFYDLVTVRLGFDRDNVMIVRTRLPYPNNLQLDRYRTPAEQAPFFREVLRRMNALPGVGSAALGDPASIPLDASQRELKLLAEGSFFLEVEGRETPPGLAPISIDRTSVTPDYFRVLGLRVLRGRLFGDLDTATSPLVAVVSEAFAHTYWPDQDAVGKRFRNHKAGSPWITIVGIVANARTESLESAEAPQAYFDLLQTGSKHLAILLRGRFDQTTIADQVRAEVQSVDSDLPVFGARTLDATVSAALANRRFSLEIVGLFALTALLLAAFGIYGVIACMVSERRREIGIRLALGAQPQRIVRSIVRQGFALTIAGAVLGLFGAIVVARLIAGLLYGVSPSDLRTLLPVALVLVAVALVASYIPARRATGIDPIVVLKSE